MNKITEIIKSIEKNLRVIETRFYWLFYGCGIITGLLIAGMIYAIVGGI